MHSTHRWHVAPLLIVMVALLACKSGGKDIHKTPLVGTAGEDDGQKYSVELPKGMEQSEGAWRMKDDAVELTVSISPNTTLRAKSYYEQNGTIDQYTEVIDSESVDGKTFVVFYKPGSTPELWAIVNRNYLSSSAIGCAAILKYRDPSAYKKVEHSNWLKKICRSAKRTDVPGHE